MACNRRRVLRQMVTLACTGLSAPTHGSSFTAYPALPRSSLNVATTPELILQNITVSSRARAEYVLQQLNEGKSFSELAREYSIDASGRNGGNLGAVKLTSLSPKLREALQGVNAGEITAITETSSGYCILKVLRPLTAVSGFDQAEFFFARIKKPPGFAQDFREICSLKSKAVAEGEEFVKTYTAQLEAGPPSPENPRLLLGAVQWLGQIAAYEGNFEEAISRLQQGNRLSIAYNIQNSRLHIEEEMGATYLRRGFGNQLVRNYTADRFLLPIESRGRNISGADAQSAVDHFLKSLKRHPDDVEVEWLLN
ncbi:MAG TPA: peptidylprolyl isomerase, partial [Terriglobia bacterium]|nr:peptidylprolyl isomerase [Terriglobia bacterium]